MTIIDRFHNCANDGLDLVVRFWRASFLLDYGVSAYTIRSRRFGRWFPVNGTRSYALAIDDRAPRQPEVSWNSVQMTQSLRTLSFAILVGVSYYFGTRIGFFLTPSQRSISVFWPPNAILFAALLLAPTQIWWALLLAVLPVHMFAQMQAGVPAWTALGWFLSNTGEALIGVICINRFVTGKRLFDSVRGVLAFLSFGVILAPLVTSFLDAAVVVGTGWGRGYWAVGATRFFTNTLAELTIVPLIVSSAVNGSRWIREATPIRYLEAAVLVGGIVTVSILVFGSAPPMVGNIPALMYAPLPLLLWAVVRFGSGGLSICLLGMALISIWNAMQGRGPFTAASMVGNILSLQVLLCTVTVPLLFLAAVMVERRRTEESLRDTAGRLIDAQEEEHKRIAREIHDDYNQRLAVLANDLDELAEHVGESPRATSERLHQLWNGVSEIAADLHTLSHSLHPSTLENLGLVAGMKAFCDEFSGQQQMKIHFASENVPRAIPTDVALCLFRVTQEGLRNIKRHSGTNRAEVRLERIEDKLHLSICDRGRGFDVNQRSPRSGIGIRSMEERLRFLGGHLEVQSRPMEGTRIDAWLPFEAAGRLAS
jgi:signal transduction histidine kinase